MKAQPSTFLPARRSLRHGHRSPGFTLVEVLVVVCILAVLAVISASVASRIKKSGMMAKELGAAGNLTAAMMLASQENNGVLPYGFDGNAKGFTVENSGFKNTVVTGEQAHRYPWRLAPYFGFKFDGVTVVDSRLQAAVKQSPAYMLSLLPSLGINTYGIGGYVENGMPTVIPGAITRMTEAVAPEKMIAFASARAADTRIGGIAPGFHMVTPPKSPGGDWSAKYSESNPDSWGKMDLRHNDQAVVAYLDGSAGVLGREKLKDMRLWNNEAARLDDPNHRPVVTTGGGRDR